MSLVFGFFCLFFCLFVCCFFYSRSKIVRSPQWFRKLNSEKWSCGEKCVVPEFPGLLLLAFHIVGDSFLLMQRTCVPLGGAKKYCSWDIFWYFVLLASYKERERIKILPDKIFRNCSNAYCFCALLILERKPQLQLFATLKSHFSIP